VAILNHCPFGVSDQSSVAMEKNITAVVKRQSYTVMNTGQSDSVFPSLHANNLLFYPWKSSAACIFKSIKHATLQQWGTKRKQRVDYLFSLQMLQYKLGVVHYTTSYHIDSSCISISICTDFIYITWAYIYFSLNLAPILITYAGKLDQNLSDAWTPGLLIEIDRSYGTLQLQCVWTFPLASDLLNPLP